jgi:hypothetical protein
MKREIKQEQKVAQETVNGPSPIKRSKVMVANALTVEKTTSVKQQNATVFEETKAVLVDVPRSNASANFPPNPALTKKSKKSAEVSKDEYEPMKVKKALASYVFFAT